MLDQLTGRKADLVVLCYHSVDSDNWLHAVSFSVIKKQIDYLKKNYQLISVYDLELFLLNKKELTKPSAVIIFDDGYKDIYKTRSFFKKFPVKPAVFLLADEKMLDRQAMANHKLLLNKQEIKNLLKDGWEIGSHGCTHTDFNKINKDQINYEIAFSKKILEKLYSVKVKYFAYPKGSYNPKILAAIKKTGYKLAFSMDDSLLNQKSNKYILPRIGVNRSHTFSEFKAIISPSVIQMRQFLKIFGVERWLA